MGKYKFGLLFIILFPYSIVVHSQIHTIDRRVPLTTASYHFSPFQVSLELCWVASDEPAHTAYKLPEGWSGICVLRKHLQRIQNNYYLFKKGMLTDSFAIKALTGYRTPDFAGTYLDESVNILMGLDEHGAKGIIIDANNDNDFTNDRVYPEKYFKGRTDFYPVHNLQFYNRYTGRVDTTTLYIRPNVGAARSYNISSTIDSMCYLELKIRNDFKEGSTRLRKNLLLAFKINNSDYINKLYDSSNTEIYPFINGQLFFKRGFNKSYHIGDTVKISDQFEYIHFLGIATDGGSLHIEFMKLTKRAIGYQTGFTAVPIVKKNIINDSMFDSRNSLGKKYVLLDFWGTWCAPCREIMPGIIELHNVYQKQIDFVSVAYDTKLDLVKKYLSTENITWTNLFETGGKVEAKSGIVKNYRVIVYPTLILIDKAGTIVFREDGTDALRHLQNFLKSKGQL